jgi:UDP-N-acetylglucosamine diphosphorylase / glucose-1-phosphate thymidylyltransferase / UDP-N-acetylgalactosamine diphosphorylase / glucosamine-1-phosphate N-acetyltransferase / galactosamine-1-phosphate N-acetyltransferase
MSGPAIYLFDDAHAREWQPFALTRPCGELLLGAYTFRERAERLFGGRCAGHISAPHLRGFSEPGAAPVVDPATIGTEGERLFVSARAVIQWGGRLPAGNARRNGDDAAGASRAGPGVLVVGGEAAGWHAPAGAPNPSAAWLQRPTIEATVHELAGRMLRHVWELVAENPRQIAMDHDAAGDVVTDPGAAGGYHVLGDATTALRLGREVTIEPNVVIDVRSGPVWLDDGVTVRAFTRLSGPAYVGPGSTLLGGPYAAISIGPVCKVHGEMEETVVLGYSNKAHDGFLGHAYLGRWVNLGAMTTNSDLKNNYGRIRMWTPAGDVDTGLMKLGCLLGDHVKTGIGALLNTGTVIGAGSNLYGTEMPPKYVAPFSWGSGAELVAYDVDRFLGVAATVHERRGIELEEGMQDVLRRAWRIGRGED